jgi:hypothetical protein
MVLHSNLGCCLTHSCSPGPGCLLHMLLLLLLLLLLRIRSYWCMQHAGCAHSLPPPGRSQQTRPQSNSYKQQQHHMLGSPAVQHAVALLVHGGVAAPVAGCQLAHGGAPTLADVVEAHCTALCAVGVVQVEPADTRQCVSCLCEEANLIAG